MDGNGGADGGQEEDEDVNQYFNNTDDIGYLPADHVNKTLFNR